MLRAGGGRAEWPLMLRLSSHDVETGGRTADTSRSWLSQHNTTVSVSPSRLGLMVSQARAGPGVLSPGPAS